jgi:MFS family permease
VSAVTPAPSRRNIFVLVGAQAFAAAAPPVIVSLGGIIGQTIAPDKALATLPVSLFTVGVALGTIPVAMLVGRIGRRPTYVLGGLIGVAGGLLAAFAVFGGSFWLFCLATLLVGLNGACVMSYRFAAVELAGGISRGGAIGLVMMGGLAAAVIGPQEVIWTRDLVPGVPFVASFVGQAALIFLALLLVLRLDAPRVRVVRTAASRSLREIARTPRFLVAVGTGVVSYATMSFVMTAAPIAMVGCGHSVGEAALGIQWHVLAMYGPSFFTGRLIKRFGEERITLCGLALIATGAVLALSGVALFNFWGTLVLLGVGWNFGFIGASSIVAGCARAGEQARLQGMNDFLVFGATALASLLSGNLMHVAGWSLIAWSAMAAVTGAAAMLLFTTWRTRKRLPEMLVDIAIP